MTELGDVSHTPPHEERNPVQRRYQRGPDAVADGGEEATPDETDADAEADEETLADVDHTAPDGDGVNNVYRRGVTEE